MVTNTSNNVMNNIHGQWGKKLHSYQFYRQEKQVDTKSNLQVVFSS